MNRTKPRDVSGWPREGGRTQKKPEKCVREKPMPDDPLALSVLAIFAQRAAVELARTGVYDHLSCKNHCKGVTTGPTNSMMKKLILTLFVAILALPLAAQTKALLNLDKTGLAIQGYDPVAFFTEGKPVKGKPELAARHRAALYYFASKEHRDLFEADPEKYEPAFGGYCAYGVSRNKLAEIDVEAFQIVDGHLLLQYSKGVRDAFNQDTGGNLAKARANWPALVEKKGK